MCIKFVLRSDEVKALLDGAKGFGTDPDGTVTLTCPPRLESRFG